MSAKVSGRLNELLLHAPAHREVALNLRMKRDMSSSQVKESMARIQQLSSGDSMVEYLPITGSVHCCVPVSQINSIGAMDDVESIDLERVVPIEELLDGEPM